MMAFSHVAISVSAWGVLVASGNGTHDWRAFGLAAVASLLPDLDHPKSWLGRRLPFLSHPIAAVFGHRGITHSLLAVVAALMAWSTALGWMGPPLALGYLSHLAADALTPQGVPLLWPIKRRFGLALCTTGGAMERLLVAATVGTALWLLRARLTGVA
ncbi:MAG TPA: metal-dependent hydrolase [Patescibacteria group bacterium]|nr:metal-dependent hydrolase [Patescibacteria group bacterium]